MMKMKNISYCLFAGLLLGACSGGVYEKTENGVIVKVQQKGDTGARLVRLQVMGEKLIHVSATTNAVYGGSAGRYRYGVYRRGACLGVGIDRRGMVYR